MKRIILLVLVSALFFGCIDMEDFFYKQFPVENPEELITIARNHVNSNFPDKYVISSPEVSRQIGKKIIVENESDKLEYLVVEAGRWNRQTEICSIKLDSPVMCAPYSSGDTWPEKKLPNAKMTEQEIEVFSVDFEIEDKFEMGPNPGTLSVYLNKDKKPFAVALHDVLYVD